MKENADKARALDTPEIHKQLRDGADQMFRLRFQLAMGQTDGLKKIHRLKKDRARMLTVIRERELRPEEAAQAAEAAKKSVKTTAKKSRKSK